MSLTEQPKIVYKGEDKTYLLLVVDDAVPPAPVDITGFTIEFEVKTGTGVADPAVIAKSVGAGIVIDPDQVTNKGEASLTVDSADTSAPKAKVYKYDVVTVNLSGKRKVVIPPSNYDLREVVNQA